ncbi:MAG: FAD-dependent thymidylate synthase [Elusimicrobia bacterium]|nr:FAD-dependent thymidylate synthase [Elusimicrobiota bacterium]
MTQTKQKTDGHLHNILDKGFVKLVDFMGGDSRAVDSARVSFGSKSKGEEQDKRLIEYLIKHQHHTPFEHCVFQFHIKCPIFVARQWMRHRWGSFNEVSSRYSEVKEEFYIPEKFRVQDRLNKQGSIDSSSFNNEELIKEYSKSITASYETYKSLLSLGIAREMARMALPVAQYTQFYWTVNARSLLNFLFLRMDAHAQLEIRKYADAMAEIFKQKMPWTWDAFSKINATK